MRLLPRTVRGTWRLAGAAWLAGCAALWWAAPIVPRAEWALPEQTAVLGFAAEPGTVLVQRQTSPGGAKAVSPLYALELLDAATGAHRGTLLDRHQPVSALGRSRDGRHWVLVRQQGDPALLRLDTVERRVDPLMVGEGVCPPQDECALSSDGRYFAFLHPNEEHVVVLWDLPAGRRHGELRGVKFPLAFAADGRCLAVTCATAPDAPPVVRVFDLPGLTPRTTLRGPDGQGVQRLRISDDGTWVAAGFSPHLTPLSDAMIVVLASELCCWETTTGALRRREAVVADFELAATDQLLWTHPWFGPTGGQTFLCDLRSADVRGCTIPNRININQDGINLAPDGHSVLLGYADTSAGPVERLTDRLGLPWPFTPSGGVTRARLFDTATGRPLGDIDAMQDCAYWSPAARALLVVEPDDPQRVRLWDVPPRTSLAWFVAAAAAWALPVGLLARRRVRRLRVRGA